MTNEILPKKRAKILTFCDFWVESHLSTAGSFFLRYPAIIITNRKSVVNNAPKHGMVPAISSGVRHLFLKVIVLHFIFNESYKKVFYSVSKSVSTFDTKPIVFKNAKIKSVGIRKIIIKILYNHFAKTRKILFIYWCK